MQAFTNVGNSVNGTFFGNNSRSWSLCADGFFNPDVWGVTGYVSIFGNDSNFSYPARTLLFQSAASAGDAFLAARCSLTTAYVEPAVECKGRNCSVRIMRGLILPYPTPSLTDLSFTTRFIIFSTAMMASGGAVHVGYSSLPELFLASPDDASVSSIASANFSVVTPRDASVRLQQMLNTY